MKTVSRYFDVDRTVAQNNALNDMLSRVLTDLMDETELFKNHAAHIPYVDLGLYSLKPL